MSKNTLMVLALLVTLLSGWLVLSLAQESQVSAPTSGVTQSVTTPSPSGSSTKIPVGPTETTVQINEGTKTSVEVK
jgi:hypothetical protein